MHLKTNTIREYTKNFEMIETWLIENDEDTDNRFVKFRQNNENLIICVFDIEKITHKAARYVGLSAVGYGIDDTNDNENKVFLLKKLVI